MKNAIELLNLSCEIIVEKEGLITLMDFKRTLAKRMGIKPAQGSELFLIMAKQGFMETSRREDNRLYAHLTEDAADFLIMYDERNAK
jgi:hypothetical protein